MAHVEDVTSIADYDAVILGSAIYLGKWTKRAKQVVNRHAAELATRPVWVYSSGPIPRPEAKAGWLDCRLAGRRLAGNHRQHVRRGLSFRDEFRARLPS